jgi:hypothetical protein
MWHTACSSRRLSLDFLFLAYRLALCLPHPAEKARTRHSIKQALAHHSLPAPAVIPITLESSNVRPLMARLVRTTLATLAARRPWQASTMRLSTRFIGPYPTLARQALFNAPSATRNCKFDDAMADPTFIQNALYGTDMLRVSCSAKRPHSRTT